MVFTTTVASHNCPSSFTYFYSQGKGLSDYSRILALRRWRASQTNVNYCMYLHYSTERFQSFHCKPETTLHPHSAPNVKNQSHYNLSKMPSRTLLLFNLREEELEAKPQIGRWEEKSK